MDRPPDPGSSEKSANHQGFRVSTLLIHPLDRAESMQDFVLIHAAARMGIQRPAFRNLGFQYYRSQSDTEVSPETFSSSSRSNRDDGLSLMAMMGSA